ncbi:type III-B CRISPR module RAMP protein Cmr6 [Thermodesulfatator atlanticus]
MPRPRPRRNQRRGPRERPRPFRPLPGEFGSFFERPGPVLNFGLYFNKGLYAYWQTKKGLKFPEYQFRARKEAQEVLDTYRRLKPILERSLERKHQELNELCRAFEACGYTVWDNTYTLKSPLVIGLGNAHPTERGFTFLWTLGVPYIPAESIKGVLRLAYLIARAEENPDFLEHWAKEDNLFWDELSAPFGREEKHGKPAQRGQVVFLDALPVKTPEFTLEITTCHYPDYYGERHGPTEDQHPIPLLFLAVAPGSEFRFVLLAHEDLGQDTQQKVKEAFSAAIAEHGFGAKTALGHGRFEP